MCVYVVVGPVVVAERVVEPKPNATLEAKPRAKPNVKAEPSELVLVDEVAKAPTTLVVLVVAPLFDIEYIETQVDKSTQSLTEARYNNT